MSAAPPVSATKVAARSERFHLWRSRKDAVVRWLIAVGGVGVILAVVLIFFYLVWVVFPLFLPATSHVGDSRVMPGWNRSEPVYFSIEEQQEVGLRVASTGQAEFFHTGDGRILDSINLPFLSGEQAKLSAAAPERNGTVALASANGNVVVLRHRYETRFDGGVETRRIEPKLEFPYGEEALLKTGSAVLVGLALSDSESAIVVAAVSESGQLWMNQATKAENFLTGEITLEPSEREARFDFEPTGVAISGNHRWLYLSDDQGRIHRLNLASLERQQTVEVSDSPITAMTMLLGGISILAGDADGEISQLFPVRTEQNEFQLELIRRFEPLSGAVTAILTEQRRKGFMALDAAQQLGIYHSTAGRMVYRSSLAEEQPRALALAPRANGLMIEGAGGSLRILDIDNEHPEVSFSSLWSKVWYENYEEPEYVWQSSAATNEFEPKFSLTPLVFGTVKAALYAMLFAIPLALMGAAYTGYFMSAELRKWVKPGIEIMAALPTVILGFLAGLWFAPWVEENLAHLFLMALLIPPGLLAFAWLWHRWEHPLKDAVPEGWEPILLIPALLLSGAAAIWLADPVQAVLFQGDMRNWLTSELGISYDQRNALVVGCAMGFAVIPTIFSIAEDAVFGVPKSLSNGSLALGATPWQTLIFVVLPTASPGIFSALMIGLGRAVGEEPWPPTSRWKCLSRR
jgi:phosphate transport system permease protein